MSKEIYLLTEEYLQLAEELKKLFEIKKQKKADFKVVYEKFQNELKEVDEQAKEIEKQIDALKSSN